MTIAPANHIKRVLSKIFSFGFLLESDPKLPSVCSIITGAPIRGSWWSHPLARTIFQVNERLEDHPDVLITKLVSGKVTFVHRNLWSEIVVLGCAREPWQMNGLSASAKKLLKTVEGAGALRTDQIGGLAGISRGSQSAAKNKPGEVVRDLEQRLLIHADQIHTESGAHAKHLETWRHWCERKSFVPTTIRPSEVRRSLAERLRKLNDEFGATARLPWSRG